MEELKHESCCKVCEYLVGRLRKAEDTAEHALNDVVLLNNDRRDFLARIAELEAQASEPRLPAEAATIMELWPRFEDGKPVLIGDSIACPNDWAEEVLAIDVHDDYSAVSVTYYGNVVIRAGETAKRPKLAKPEQPAEPEQPVEPADGFAKGIEDALTVEHINEVTEKLDKLFNGGIYEPADSWERLEADANAILAESLSDEVLTEHYIQALSEIGASGNLVVVPEGSTLVVSLGGVR